MSREFHIEAQDYSRFTFSRDGRILTAWITSDHPVNGVDEPMHEELARVFTDLQRDTGSDIIILAAKGRAFCAGGDFDWFQEQVDHPERFRDIAWDAKRIVSSLLDMEKPILCRLHGAAAGLGATIALLCDIIVADETAKIGDPHVKVGLVAGDGGTLIWPQLIGFARAKELLMTGDMLTGAEAKDLGLVNHALPADQVDAKLGEIIGKLTANPKWAVRWTKTVTNIPLRALMAQVMDAAIGWESVSNTLEDRREAVAAMAGKRAPKFTGE
ncbi:enoyl-CoA hydratase/isomerase family protein [Pacificimonas sp. WHA3]|uniref:Enoyl-CoA hydratase/isomerase family protein n=1 Tax=Pacificimonas pallii TaxID=2827236 RepID=A0ABS6SFL4_9SPHN|nr:enoyl-CoA hydratase/isomerase family protein [Pacificimonas pallii]MBV7257194.1 enoyl-CoA hydratase/isomerase family protein [Pacificimonas pallii]